MTVALCSLLTCLADVFGVCLVFVGDWDLRDSSFGQAAANFCVFDEVVRFGFVRLFVDDVFMVNEEMCALSPRNWENFSYSTISVMFRIL